MDPKQLVGAVIAEEGNTLRDGLTVLFRHRRKAQAVFLAVFGLVALVTLFSPNVYQAEAKLLLKPGRESLAVDPTVPEGRTINLTRGMQEEIKSELEILRNRVLAQRVVEALGPQYVLAGRSPAAEGGPPEPARRGAATALRRAVKRVIGLPRWAAQQVGLVERMSPSERAARKLIDDLDIRAVPNSTIIRLTLRSRSPVLARRALEKLIDLHLEQHVRVYQTGSSHEFFAEQARAIRAELQQTEEAIRRFKDRADLAVLTEQRAAVVARLADLERQAQETSVQLRASQALIAATEKILAGLPATTTLDRTSGRFDTFMDNARTRLLDLRLQEKALLSKYPENHRLVRDIRTQIKEVEDMMAGSPPTRTEVRTGANASHQAMEVALVKEKARAASLEKRFAALEDAVASMKPKLRALNESTRTPPADPRGELPQVHGPARGGAHRPGPRTQEDLQHRHRPTAYHAQQPRPPPPRAEPPPRLPPRPVRRRRRRVPERTPRPYVPNAQGRRETPRHPRAGRHPRDPCTGAARRPRPLLANRAGGRAQRPARRAGGSEAGAAGPSANRRPAPRRPPFAPRAPRPGGGKPSSRRDRGPSVGGPRRRPRRRGRCASRSRRTSPRTRAVARRTAPARLSTGRGPPPGRA